MLTGTVFELSARLAVMARNTAQTISTLSGLVPGLYTAVSEQAARSPAVKRGAKGREDVTEEMLVEGVAEMTLGETEQTARHRRAHSASLLLLYHLCHTGSFEMYWSTLQSLTALRHRRLSRPYDSTAIAGSSERDRAVVSPAAEEPFISLDQVRIATRCARYLSPHTFDPISFFHLALTSPVSAPRSASSSIAGPGEPLMGSVSPHERAIMQWAVPTVRDRAWAVMRKAYLEVRLPWAGQWVGIPQMPKILKAEDDGWGEGTPEARQREEELRVYIERQGLKVDSVSGRIKLRL